MIDLRLAFTLCAALLGIGGPAHAQARPVQTAPAMVAALTSSACYALASGAVQEPADGAPGALEQRMKLIEGFGLEFGVPSETMAELGRTLSGLISRATLGSKKLPDGLVVFADQGAPGCRILLLADPRPGITDSVGTALMAGGWRAIPEMTATRGTIERRAFLRRDKAGAPYLLNLMTLLDDTAKLRLFTTVAKIPAGVALPPGY
jgi:hypothetical protein